MDDCESRAFELADLASRLRIPIHDFALFDRALTHASMAAETEEPAPDYEALEFLGDAVLGLVVAHYLFEVFPGRTPGEYSRMRAGLVNHKVVGRVACELGIGSAIRLGKGEEQSGGRTRKALLGDCLEALVGAVYLDCGWHAAHEFVVRVFRADLSRAHALDGTWDFKSRLQNFCQAERLPLPEFVVVRSEGPDHKKEFEVEVRVRNMPSGRGKGSTKKEAEQNAAREALEHEGQHFG